MVPGMIVLAQEDATSWFASGLAIVLYLAFVLFVVIGMWRVFEKAGKPGWASLIPFYNVWVLCEIAGRPGWWLLLFFIPFVNFIVWIILCVDIAAAYGHGVGFAIGLMFLTPLFFLILGYGPSTYRAA